MRKISVFGVGYVGLVTGTCFADQGHQVTCVDVDEPKIEKLRAGIMPIYEPGLEEMVRRNALAGRLRFTSSYSEGLAGAEYAFIAVGTPQGSGGEADLQYVRAAADGIAEAMDHPVTIVNKSTVPIGTGDWVSDIVRRRQTKPVNFWVVSNPEFLREGSAISDFLFPDRVVLGSMEPEAAAQVAQLYLSIRAPIILTDLRTAEMIKYASNAFLATRISFINEIASICEALGADVKEVAVGMGYDKRIGPQFLDAGIGYGGSCFPKDVQALAHMAAVHGCHPQLLRAVIDINRDQRRQVVQKLRSVIGRLDEKVVGILGLAFKPNTDDMREAPSVEIIHLLQSEGAKVRAYDPVAMPNAPLYLRDVALCEDAYEVAEGADALVMVTEWNEFKHLDLVRLKAVMRQPVIVDGRNMYDPEAMRALGFTYRAMGRGQAR
ncbi:MAG TPA: UDP-glucose/GDP-mannose dehydrogenase family protein [Anaerolineae bacterium]|nr:UDP-glucose/GDP-mannose dehydrogenase family protein [Anaerolineae bacterium]